MKRVVLSITVAALAVAANAFGYDNANCRGLPTAAQLRGWLRASSGTSIGGLFNGERMWAAVVNRDGELCSAVTSTDDPTQVWPGSQALSTARLYTFTQPGHSLWSLGQSNPFDPAALAPPSGVSGGNQRVNGGQIFFGGGLPLYSGGKIIGGLGISGDTSCADHEIAKRVRNLGGLNPPASLGGMLGDDIVYSPPDAPSVFAHPVCLNTKRNGVAIGDEIPATYPRVPPQP
jgi:uncharacterized protein GlcG (DUF336 family)